MEEVGNLPLKRVELSLTKFNEVAIPHHLDLLRQHKANIIKYGESGESIRVRAEQTNARRVAGQLRVLLDELDTLRGQVRQEERARFDALTQRSRDLTLRAIVDYLESSPVRIRARTAADECGGEGQPEGEGEGVVCGSAVSTESVGVVSHAHDAHEHAHAHTRAHITAPAQLQLHHDEQEAQLAEREAVLRGWGELQREVRALHDTWQRVHEAAAAQRDQVSAAGARVHAAADNAAAARGSLASAERLRAGLVSVGCAALGAALGGPVGLVAGVKAGAAAAMFGAAAGLLAARLPRPVRSALSPPDNAADSTERAAHHKQL